MMLQIYPDSQSTARAAAQIIAAAAQEAVAQRGRCVLAVSGGRTPGEMLRGLSGLPLPWPYLHVFQVDERQAPPGSPHRNLTHLQAALLGPGFLHPEQLHPMPVDQDDLAAAAVAYAAQLQQWAGNPPVLDLIHLGLGADGHTASLIPGDPVLDVADREVAATGPYQGFPRLTLTYPALNRARQILWLVTGPDKAPVLPRLLAGDPTLPAGRVRRENAIILADAAAARLVPAARTP
jgi:6-phosphogluconolactonase